MYVAIIIRMVCFMREKCPKCGGQAWYCVEDDIHLVLKCVCGINKLVYSDYPEGGVKHVVPKREILMPPPGTKLSKCIGMMALNWPEMSTTQILADSLSVSTSEAASQLVVLLHKGIVEKVKEGRGVVGGSTWKLSNTAARSLRLLRKEG